jgi:hypothetical protein
MKLIFCILTLLLTLNVSAQRRKYRSSAHSLMVQGGVNLAKRSMIDKQVINGTPPQKTGLIVSENFSASYEYRINDIISIMGGFALNGRGYVRTMSITYINPNDTIIEKIKYFNRFQYIDLPIALKIRTEMGRDFYFYGYIGPYICSAITGRGTTALIRADITGLYITKGMGKIDLNKDYERRFDFGYRFGGGVEVKCFFFEAAFAGGLRDIYKPIMFGGKIKTKNQVGMFSLGYRFSL